MSPYCVLLTALEPTSQVFREEYEIARQEMLAVSSLDHRVKALLKLPNISTASEIIPEAIEIRRQRIQSRLDHRCSDDPKQELGMLAVLEKYCQEDISIDDFKKHYCDLSELL